MIRNNRRNHLFLIHVSAVVVSVAVIVDSVFYMYSQRGPVGGVRSGADLERVLFFVSVICFLGLVFFFMRIIRRYRADIRIHEVQYRIVQSMSRVIAFEYDRDSDKFTYTYYNGGELERHCCEAFLKDKSFRAFLREDYADTYETLFRQVLAAPVRETAEFPMKIIGDEIRWYRLTYQSLMNDHGYGSGIVGSAIDVNDLVVARDEAREEAATDALTGLLGKAAFAARASERMKNKKAAPATLLMIDLDDFKEINDTKGHIEGDRILSSVAMLLQRVFSADDLIGRFGGDEFVVFMQGISTEDTEKKLRHFRRRLAELLEDGSFGVTCSIGAVCESDGGATTFGDILQRADEAMYQTKRRGKDSFAVVNGCVL